MPFHSFLKHGGLGSFRPYFHYDIASCTHIYFRSLITSLASTCSEKEDESISNVRIISSGGLIPTARFVEEILARSRTTPAVLKVAMTYLETLLPQLPELQASYAENVSVHDFSLDSLPKSGSSKYFLLAYF